MHLFGHKKAQNSQNESRDEGPASRPNFFCAPFSNLWATSFFCIFRVFSRPFAAMHLFGHKKAQNSQRESRETSDQSRAGTHGSEDFLLATSYPLPVTN
jgi:hypothetical protein